MTPLGAARRIARPIKKVARAASINVMREFASHNSSRKTLNRIYNAMSPIRQEKMHTRFSTIFYGGTYPNVEPGIWVHDFDGRIIRTAISAETAGFDWALALSVLGHDAPIKQSYRFLLRQPEPPDLFIDIGTNYGTHSILFLVHGIRTVSFEPNSSCHQKFRDLCALNKVIPHIEATALGSSNTPLELCFPEGAEWLGSTRNDVISALRADYSLTSQIITQRRLDEYEPMIVGHRRIVIKIDTEGAEADIIRGGSALIMKFRPTIIFECECLSEMRAEVFGVLGELGYKITTLPLGNKRAPRLSLQEFHEAKCPNFGALPS
jgi:FkbM family methyltransferase